MNNFQFQKIWKKLKLKFRRSKFNYYRHLLHQIWLIPVRKSYFSQTGEDILIEKYFLGNEGFYIDIGSGHPIKGSNSYKFYRKGWSGICIDPISKNNRMHRILRRRDSVIRALVGQSAGMKTFWEFDPYEYSTADPRVAEECLRNDFIEVIEVSQLQVIPLSQILASISIQSPSFLTLDVEGMDLDVLKSNNWDLYKPDVICVEEWNKYLGKVLQSDIQTYLSELNYIKVAYTGLSSIYIKNK